MTLRSLGDVVDGVTPTRLDTPEVAAIKGRCGSAGCSPARPPTRRPRRPSRSARSSTARRVRVDAPVLDRIRAQVLPQPPAQPRRPRPSHSALAEAAWASVREGDRAEFMERFEDHLEVDAFLAAWWPQVDPREVLLWLADPERVRRTARRPRYAGERPVRRVDAAGPRDRHLVGRRRRPRRRPRRPARPGPGRAGRGARASTRSRSRGRLAVRGRRGPRPASTPAPSAPSRRAPPHRPARAAAAGPDRGARRVRPRPRRRGPGPLPMQWRMLGRRGRYSSWTVVGDAAQASWPDAVESGRAREEAFGTQERRLFHMDTNYRNAREIFDYAARCRARAACPTPTSPRRSARRGSSRSTEPSSPGVYAVGGSGGGREGSRPRSRVGRRHHPV